MEKRITEILILAMAAGAKIEIQYRDYDENTWTVPMLITPRIIECLTTDASVANVRLTLHP